MERKAGVGVGKEEVRVLSPESIIEFRKDLRACLRGENVFARAGHGLECGTKARDWVWWAIAGTNGAQTPKGKDGRKSGHDRLTFDEWLTSTWDVRVNERARKQ